MKTSTLSNAAPIPELSDMHKSWITNLQKDHPELPLGYARALVELYVSQPSLFTKQNIDRWAAEKPPLVQSTNGEVRVLSAEESAAFESSLPQIDADTVCVSNTDAKHFDVTDRNGDAVELCS